MKNVYRTTLRWVIAIGFLIQISVASGQSYSDLWGKEGEKWSPQSRLPEFSFAGYHSGASPLPSAKATCNVSQFGAVGDGKTDCTKAFMRAIGATHQGVIEIPAGRFVINDIIPINRPNLVLRGAGPGKTVIICPRALEDVRPNMSENTAGRPTSNYSWSGGFFWVKGTIKRDLVAPIVAGSKRGSKTLKLTKPTELLRKGQRVTIELNDDPEKSLIQHIYSGDAGDTAKLSPNNTVRLINTVASHTDTSLSLERPLRLDLRESWSPVLKTYEPTVSEVGIENLTIEFPRKPYGGHFTERGMNGIAMNQVADCWIRNVQISNSDSGIYLRSDFCTVDGVLLDSQRLARDGTTGHHGILLGQDCLMQNFQFKTHFIHDITLHSFASGNVVKNGSGINLSLDHHRKGPFENLFCNIDVGRGEEIWRSGGGGGLGKHSGARGTFWCIQSEVPIDWPPSLFGPDSLNIIGVKSRTESIKKPSGKWYEAIPPEQLKPADLHAAQLFKRLENQSDR